MSNIHLVLMVSQYLIFSYVFLCVGEVLVTYFKTISHYTSLVLIYVMNKNIIRHMFAFPVFKDVYISLYSIN